MGKNDEDMVSMLSVPLNGIDSTQHLMNSFKGLRIGFLDPVV